VDYQRVYDQLIERARRREFAGDDSYFERHHVKPRALGGMDHESNLARLTYREHFLAHWLLTKLCMGDALRRMQYAMLRMVSRRSGRVVSGWQFEVAYRAKRDAADATSALWALEVYREPLLKERKQRRKQQRRRSKPVVKAVVLAACAASKNTGCYRREELEHLADEWLKCHGPPPPPRLQKKRYDMFGRELQQYVG
jgi:hypothetical protein